MMSRVFQLISYSIQDKTMYPKGSNYFTMLKEHVQERLHHKSEALLNWALYWLVVDFSDENDERF